MKYPEILQSFYGADNVTGYGAHSIKVKNSSFLTKEIFQCWTWHKIVANET